MWSTGAITDWHTFFARWRSPHTDVWSRFPVELAADLIVCPHLFDWPAPASKGNDVYTCAAAPRVAVFCGRGPDHLQFLEDEVLPRVARHVPRVCLVEPESDRIRWLGGPALPIDDLGPTLRAAWNDPELVIPDPDRRPLFGPPKPPTREEIAAVEAHPIRLWEALFWRGYTYRTELVDGEVPLIGDLGAPSAAAATLERVVADAAALLGDPVETHGG